MSCWRTLAAAKLAKEKADAEYDKFKERTKNELTPVEIHFLEQFEREQKKLGDKKWNCAHKVQMNGNRKMRHPMLLTIKQDGILTSQIATSKPKETVVKRVRWQVKANLLRLWDLTFINIKIFLQSDWFCGIFYTFASVWLKPVKTCPQYSCT